METLYHVMAVWNDEQPQLVETFTDKWSAEVKVARCEVLDYFHDYYIVERQVMTPNTRGSTRTR